MTTGTINKSVFPYVHDIKTWSGTDGLYIPGSKINKWNDYIMSHLFKSLSPTTGLFAPGAVTDAGANMPVFDPNLEIKCFNKIVAKAKGHSFNLAVSGAEGRQSVNLIKDTILTVGQSALDVKRGNFSIAARRLVASNAVRDNFRWLPNRREPRSLHRSVRNLKTSDVMQKWLELQYGWLPLLDDCHEASKAIDRIYQANKPIEIKSMTEKRSAAEISQAPAQYSVPLKYHEVCSMQYRWHKSPDGAATLGLEDPMSVAWEILPFSFVADWFLPIGAYLNAISQVPLLNGELMTTKYISGEGHLASIAPSWVLFYEGCSTSVLYQTLSRSVVSGPSARNVPLPRFRSFNEAMSPKHIANGLALLQTVLSSEDTTTRRFRPHGF